jgi:hypothetical protein
MQIVQRRTTVGTIDGHPAIASGSEIVILVSQHWEARPMATAAVGSRIRKFINLLTREQDSGYADEREARKHGPDSNFGGRVRAISLKAPFARPSSAFGGRFNSTFRDRMLPALNAIVSYPVPKMASSYRPADQRRACPPQTARRA